MSLLLTGFVVVGLSIVIFVISRHIANKHSMLNLYVSLDDLQPIPLGMPVVAKGVIQSDTPLEGPVTHKPCVYYSFRMEQKTEQKDKEGRVSYTWETVGSPQEQRTSFLLTDAVAKVRINASHAQIESPHVSEQILHHPTAETNSIVQSVITVLMTSAQKDLTRKVIEHGIYVGETVYVFGVAKLEGNETVIEENDAYKLIVSTKSKHQLISSIKRMSDGLMIAAFAGLICGLVLIGLHFS